ncbi:MAG: SPFH domain-containing protein [Myxococcota bacterium]|jgi:flotillin|nr:SPFH domain-containing protein [Myxococcota bacterium]
MGAIAAVALIVVLSLIAMMIIIKNMLYICEPNEVLIFSGRKRRLASGQLIGYRIIKGGRTLRIPLMEKVDRMDLTNMNVKVTTRGAFSRGGIPLNVEGVANLKIAGHEPVLNNAIERFLGKPREEIIGIAKETLEGNLRGVLSTLTPEQVNEDKVAFAESLLTEAAHDMVRLGLQLDTLTIQNVADEMGYLDSIGRQKNAALQRDVAIAQARAQAEAAIKDAENKQNSTLAEIGAAIQIAQAESARRLADTISRKDALVAEQQTEVNALVARAKADLRVEQARLEKLRMELEADVIQPAKAEMEAAVAAARGQAAKVVEDGRATIAVLNEIAATWKKAGSSARDVFLMQKLESVLQTLLSTIRDVQVNRLTVVDTRNEGNGQGKPGFDIAKATSTVEQVRAALGVDLPRLLEKLGDRATAAVPAPAPPSPPPAPPRPPRKA